MPDLNLRNPGFLIDKPRSSYGFRRLREARAGKRISQRDRTAFAGGFLLERSRVPDGKIRYGEPVGIQWGEGKWIVSIVSQLY